jgi:hypothetical protein
MLLILLFYTPPILPSTRTSILSPGKDSPRSGFDIFLTLWDETLILC